MRVRTIRRPEFALAVFTLFTLLAGQFWRNTVGWYGFGAIVGILLVIYATLLVKHRETYRHRGFPLTLLVFIGWATASLMWSAYPATTALALGVLFATTLGAFGLAYLMPWSTFVRALSYALRTIIGLSLLFEVWVALVVHHPIMPFFATPNYSRDLPETYWCAGTIFEGAPIQGILGNRNLMAFVALLAVIVVAIQLADKVISRLSGWTWLTLSVIAFALTQSMTVIFAGLLVLILGLFAQWARHRGDGRHRLVYGVGALTVAGLVVIAISTGPVISKLIGRNPDFTGRTWIWNVALDLWKQHPVVGWGWISYWAPWVKPFKDLIVIHSITYLQAHSAWLDVLMQLGLVGLILFIVFVVTALWRAWFRAVDRPRWDINVNRPFVAMHMLPLFLLACLIAQSFVESRMLIEGGWALLVICAVATKLPDTLNEHPRLIDTRVHPRELKRIS